MSLTPKINIPSLFREKKVGLTPRADYRIVTTVASGKSVGGADAVSTDAVPTDVVRRLKQTVNDPANKGVKS